MTLKKIVLFSMLIIAAPLHADEYSDFFSAYERIHNINAIKSGTYKQEKIIKALRSPLKSNGKYSYDPKGELLWQQESPFVQKIVITKDGITIYNDHENEDQLSSIPMTTYTRSILSLFSVDPDGLKQSFEVNIKGDIKDWQLNLVPKESQVRNYLNKLIIEGKNDRLEKITVSEGNGDSTIITLQ